MRIDQNARNPWPYVIVFAFAAGVSSLPDAFKYLHGWPGVIGYSLWILILAALLPKILDWIFQRVSPRMMIAAGIASFVLLIAMYAVIYPQANSTDPSRGTDRDEALNIAVTEMIHGRYPYYPETYLGFHPSPAPGALLLATPFVLIGNSPYQMFFWLPVFAWVIAKLMGDVRGSVLALWLLCGVSLAPMHENLTGGDTIINAIYIIAAMGLVLINAPGAWWKAIASAVLLGITLSSRANHFFAIPLVFAILCNSAGAKRAFILMLVAGATLLAISLPFYLYDPAAFWPLKMQNKLKFFEGVLPHCDLWGLAVLLLLTLATMLAILRAKITAPWFAFAATGFVLTLPALYAMVLESLSRRVVSLTYAGFASSAVPWAATAVAGVFVARYSTDAPTEDYFKTSSN